MKFLLVREYPEVDGTFTLLLRLARQMHKDGHQVYFILFPGLDPVMVREFSQCAVFLKREELDTLSRKNQLPDIDAILGIAEGDFLLWMHGHLKKVLFPRARLVVGVYHPRAFIIPAYPIPFPDAVFYKQLFGKIPDSNMLFMNDEVKRTHQIYFKRDFAGSPVVPLPVEIPAGAPGIRKADRLKIVSIGRLVPFKNYITPLVSVLEKLRAEGIHFRLDVYGEGPLYEEFRQLFDSCGHSSYTLHGTIAYDQITEVLSDAGAFIGMGTAIIEASGRGVPSLQAQESNHRATTYGWFFNTEGYHIGEQMKDWTEYDMETQLRELIRIPEETYQHFCQESYRRALEFDIRSVISEYYAFMSKADPDFTFSYNRIQRFLLKAGRQPFKLLGIQKPSH